MITLVCGDANWKQFVCMLAGDANNQRNWGNMAKAKNVIINREISNKF